MPVRRGPPARVPASRLREHTVARPSTLDPAAAVAGGLRARFADFWHARSTLAFLLCLPLIAIILGLVVYPFFFAIYLAMLNRQETEFVWFDNFLFLFSRPTFWMVVQQSVLFTLTAVFFKALIGFICAHLIHNLPDRGQRIWRGLSLVPWVIPPALSTLGWWWLFDPTYSAINWLLVSLGGQAIPWLSDVFWARFSVILVNIWYGAPFFLIMYLAALKSIPEELYDAARVDGANAWQRLVYVTLPMMRNIIAITMLFSTIVTFANFDIVRVLTQGGPRNTTHLFATYAFKLGIQSGDIPLGAAVSLFMFPILALFAFFILRDVRERTRRL
jgi:multiple sugar transport system permease protein